LTGLWPAPWTLFGEEVKVVDVLDCELGVIYIRSSQIELLKESSSSIKRCDESRRSKGFRSIINAVDPLVQLGVSHELLNGLVSLNHGSHQQVFERLVHLALILYSNPSIQSLFEDYVKGLGVELLHISYDEGYKFARDRSEVVVLDCVNHREE